MLRPEPLVVKKKHTRSSFSYAVQGEQVRRVHMFTKVYWLFSPGSVPTLGRIKHMGSEFWQAEGRNFGGKWLAFVFVQLMCSVLHVIISYAFLKLPGSF